MEIKFRRPEEQAWFEQLSNVPPEEFFRSIAAAVGEYLHKEIPEETLAWLKIRIEPNVHFRRGYPQYHRPRKDKAGTGMVCSGAYRPLMILLVGYEFILTAFHEFIHVAIKNFRSRFSYSSYEEFRRAQEEEENDATSLEKWIALYWSEGQGSYLFNAEALQTLNGGVE